MQNKSRAKWLQNSRYSPLLAVVDVELQYHIPSLGFFQSPRKWILVSTVKCTMIAQFTLITTSGGFGCRTSIIYSIFVLHLLAKELNPQFEKTTPILHELWGT